MGYRMGPRFPEVHVTLRTENRWAVASAIRQALRRAGTDRAEIDRFLSEALAVGDDPEARGGEYDNARSARRQPGSIVKPFVVLQALDERGRNPPLTASSRIADVLFRAFGQFGQPKRLAGAGGIDAVFGRQDEHHQRDGRDGGCSGDTDQQFLAGGWGGGGEFGLGHDVKYPVSW